jgi:hypothetical protein
MDEDAGPSRSRSAGSDRHVLSFRLLHCWVVELHLLCWAAGQSVPAQLYQCLRFMYPVNPCAGLAVHAYAG